MGQHSVIAREVLFVQHVVLIVIPAHPHGAAECLASQLGTWITLLLLSCLFLLLSNSCLPQLPRSIDTLSSFRSDTAAFLLLSAFSLDLAIPVDDLCHADSSPDLPFSSSNYPSSLDVAPVTDSSQVILCNTHRSIFAVDLPPSSVPRLTNSIKHYIFGVWYPRWRLVQSSV